jgi:hypothetical protein
MRTKQQYLGTIDVGRFKVLTPDPMAGAYPRLTRVAMETAQPPELDEIHLDEYEGQVVLVEGNASGDWIWSASVREVAGSILSILVRKVFAAHPAPQDIPHAERSAPISQNVVPVDGIDLEILC